MTREKAAAYQCEALPASGSVGALSPTTNYAQGFANGQTLEVTADEGAGLIPSQWRPSSAYAGERVGEAANPGPQAPGTHAGIPPRSEFDAVESSATSHVASNMSAI